MKKRILFSYFRNFVPLTKRIIILAFRNKNQPHVAIEQLDRSRKKDQSYISFEVKLTNVLFLKIDGNIYPVFHDFVSMKITLPIKTNQNKIEIVAIGVFKSKKKSLDSISGSTLRFKSVLFDRVGLIANKKVNNSSPTIYKLLEPKWTISNATILDISYPKLVTHLRKKEILNIPKLIKDYRININLEEVESQLKNQVNYE